MASTMSQEQKEAWLQNTFSAALKYAAPVDTDQEQTGGNQPFSTRNPYTGLNYIIALEGIFPSRN